MPDETRNEEEKLEKLSQAVRTGWAKRHPVNEKDRALVRDAVKKQWERDKDLTLEERRRKAEREQQQMREEQTKKQGRDRGQSR